MRIGRLAHQFESRNPHPLERIRRTARLVGPAAQKRASRGLHLPGRLEDLFAALNGARAGHDQYALAANLHPVAEFDDRAFGAPAAAGQLVGRADAVNVHHPGQELKFAQVEAGRGTHTGQDGLALAGGAVDLDPGFRHSVDDRVDLVFGRLFLHGYDHCFVPVSGAWVCCAPVPWPKSSRPASASGESDRPVEAAIAWACLSDANSFRCRARITSMIRS